MRFPNTRRAFIPGRRRPERHRAYRLPARPCGDLSGQAGAHHRPLRAGRPERRPRAAGCPGADHPLGVSR